MSYNGSEAYKHAKKNYTRLAAKYKETTENIFSRKFVFKVSQFNKNSEKVDFLRLHHSPIDFTNKRLFHFTIMAYFHRNNAFTYWEIPYDHFYYKTFSM